MFTVLWRHHDGVEELFSAVNTHYGVDDGGRKRLSMQCLGVVEDKLGCGNHTFIDQMNISSGNVYVMNDAGHTVAAHKFGDPQPTA